MFDFLNKRQDDNESTVLVVDWLIVLLLLFGGVEYQGHVTQIEVIAM